jgi:oxysterol-binding protein-related protein 8
MYARGILFGKMVIELGDTCTARNDREGYIADLEFKTKVRAFFALPSPISFFSHPYPFQGFFSGTYNALAGRIRRGSTEVGEIGGRWSHVMDFKSAKVNVFQD